MSPPASAPQPAAQTPARGAWHPRHQRHWHRHLRHSLRARLVALFLLLAVGTTLVFVAGTRQLFDAGWRELVRPLLSDYVDRLTADIGSPPDIDRARQLTQGLPVRIRIDGPRVQWDSEGERSLRLHHGDRWQAGGEGPEMLSRQTEDGHRIRFGVSFVNAGETPRWAGWATLAGLLLLTLLAYATVRRLFRPLDDIRAGAVRFGRGELSLPIPIRRRDELGDLAQQLNTMAAELSRLLEGQRALLLAISHELRSPLTRARLNAELIDEVPVRQALLRDLAQMRDLIADLLESERLVSGIGALQLEPADLNALVREIASNVGRDDVGGPDGALPFELQLDPHLPWVELDSSRVRLLLRNLLGNALRHGAAATSGRDGSAWVSVHTQLQGPLVVLSIRDRGPGVAAAELAQLGQPFFRVDAARTRSQGGVGLGLYLCRRVMQAHGGQIEFRSHQPGLEVVASFPARRDVD